MALIKFAPQSTKNTHTCAPQCVTSNKFVPYLVRHTCLRARNMSNSKVPAKRLSNHHQLYYKELRYRNGDLVHQLCTAGQFGNILGGNRKTCKFDY